VGYDNHCNLHPTVLVRLMSSISSRVTKVSATRCHVCESVESKKLREDALESLVVLDSEIDEVRISFLIISIVPVLDSESRNLHF